MAVRDPWGDQQGSFENMTQKVAKPVIKAVSDAVKAVATDAKQQVTGDYGSTSPESLTSGQPPSAKAPVGAQQEEAKKKQELIMQTRQNLDQINKQILEIRHKREKQAEQAKQTEKKEKEQKKTEKKQKENEPFWKKLLQGKTGSKEGNVRAGG
jgi:hypothetical protein